MGLQVSYRLLGKGEGGRGLTADFNPGQVLGGILEGTGLGEEEELVWVDVGHFFSATCGCYLTE